MLQNVLLTGPTSGIGYEFAQIFAREGYDIVLVGKDPEKLRKLQIQLEEKYPEQKFLICEADLSVIGVEKKIEEYLTTEEIKIDILINNAGFGSFGEFVSSDWDKELAMMRVNMISVVALTKIVVGHMKERGEGKILNVASTAAFFPGPLMSVYYATKNFVLNFSVGLSRELKGTGVSVTALCPGPTESGFQKASGNEDSQLVKGKTLPTATEVAKFGYQSMMKGRVVAVHGQRNRLQVMLGKILPLEIAANIVYDTQKEG
jgi:short-subunit dehydrogenase